MGKARPPGWRGSDEDAEKLSRKVAHLYHEGYSAAALAIRFGRCEQWVREQANRTQRQQMATMAPSSL